jgi:hypothetical protein
VIANGPGSALPVAGRAADALRLSPHGGRTMRYLLTIHTDESLGQTRSEADNNRLFQDYMEYTNAMKAAGVWVAGEALHPSASGSQVRVRADKASVTDGPFTETKEVLGGFYLMEVKSKDEAIDWGKRCPDSKNGTIQLREVWNFG